MHLIVNTNFLESIYQRNWHLAHIDETNLLSVLGFFLLQRNFYFYLSYSPQSSCFQLIYGNIISVSIGPNVDIQVQLIKNHTKKHVTHCIDRRTNKITPVTSTSPNYFDSFCPLSDLSVYNVWPDPDLDMNCIHYCT